MTLQTIIDTVYAECRSNPSIDCEVRIHDAIVEFVAAWLADHGGTGDNPIARAWRGEAGESSLVTPPDE